MKVQLKGAFKSCFLLYTHIHTHTHKLSPKKKKKNHEIFFRHLHKISQLSGQYQQNGKRTYCRLPPRSFRISELTSRIHPLLFLSTPQGFIFSSEYFLKFFSNRYIEPWLQKSFKFMVLRLLENAFLLMSPSKTFPQVLTITTPQEETNHFPQTTIFIFFLSRKGGGLRR